jgi:predicted RNA-binding Zn-ribbon protein involved in translation (DUF1610 family)
MAKQLYDTHCYFTLTEPASPSYLSDSKSIWTCTTCGIEVSDVDQRSHLCPEHPQVLSSGARTTAQRRPCGPSWSEQAT